MTTPTESNGAARDMSDRELLELAAKAYGDPLIKADQPEFSRWTGWNEDMSCGVYVRWNPLTDDGDALRLAVKLELDIETWNDEVCARRSDIWGCYQERANDPLTATRRAIVRAAAAIARSTGA